MNKFVKRLFLQRTAVRMYGTVCLIVLHGVIKLHGPIPVRRKNQIFVANHTSMLDFIILSQQGGINTFYPTKKLILITTQT